MPVNPLERIILIVGTTLLLLAGCQGDHSKRNIFDYVIHHKSLHTNVRQALFGLETSVTESLAQIKQLINEAAAIETKPLRHIYQTLAKLTRDGAQDNCDHHLVLCCLSILTQSELRQFRPLVEESRARFLKCSEGSEQKIREVLLMDSQTDMALKSLDEFLRAGQKLRQDAKSDHLDRLQHLDLTRANLDFGRMLNVARKYKLQFVKTPTLTKCSAAKKLESFLTDRCKHFYLFLRGSFDRINLGQVLSREIEDKSIGTLNELQRICTQWLKPKVRQNTFKPACNVCDQSKYILSGLVNKISGKCGEA